MPVQKRQKMRQGAEHCFLPSEVEGNGSTVRMHDELRHGRGELAAIAIEKGLER
jgi:hypothetical protein